MSSFRGQLSKRLRIAVGFGIVLAVGETIAALAAGARESEFFLLQAGIALCAGLAAFALPLPTRVIAVGALAGIGGFHTAFGLHDAGGRLSALDVAVVSGQIAIVAAVAWRCTQTRVPTTDSYERRLLILFAAAYVAQAIWTARLVSPLSDTDTLTVVFSALVSAVAAPCAALLAARWFLAGRPLAGSASAFMLVALPGLVGRSVFWSAHRVGAGPSDQTAQQHPDVILIVLDTVRADRLSLYGYPRPTTPNLQRFAERATVYERAQSQGIWTLPGHASLFTGLYPSEHGADWKDGVDQCRSLRPEAFTLAERFALEGYRTACIAANWGMFTRSFGLAQGFEWVCSGRSPTAHLWVPAAAMKLATLWGGLAGRQKTGALERNSYPSAPEINALALDWLEHTQNLGPRFLFLNYMEAHDMLRRLPCAAPRFGEGRSCIPLDLLENIAREKHLSDAEATRLGDWYDSEIACLDLHLGELFDELERRGLLDGALVAVTSDHGHLLGEHDAFNHKAEVWKELTHVPLILKLPEQHQGERAAHPVETAALAFLLPRLAGIDLERPAPDRSEIAVSQSPQRFELAQLNPRYATSWTAIVDGPLKYFIDGSERIQVADWTAQGTEQLRSPTAPELERGRTLLAAWRASLLPPLGETSVEQDREAAERLRLLEWQGYAGR